MRQKKTGRRASPEERAYAQELIDHYRLAEESPDGRHCLNPESPPEEQEFFYANAEELLVVLEGFARHGTFECMEAIEFEILDIHFAVKNLRDNGLTREEAVASVAEKYHKSCRQIERELKHVSENWPEHIQNGQTESEWVKAHPKPK
jgi:hypothetical protein